TVPYITVTNLARTLRALKERGVWVVGTDDQASDSLHAVDARQPMAWVMGAEGEGMRRLTRETCDQLVNIPMLGSVESLNVSVASAVCLYESVRQRREETFHALAPSPRRGGPAPFHLFPSCTRTASPPRSSIPTAGSPSSTAPCTSPSTLRRSLPTATRASWRPCSRARRALPTAARARPPRRRWRRRSARW